MLVAMLQSGLGTIRGDLDIMVGGAALWARVGALLLSTVQLVMLYACGFSGASFGQVFLQPRAAAVLTQYIYDEEKVPTKAGWGAIVGDVRRVAGGHGGARPPSMRQSVFVRSKPIKEREDKFKQMMTKEALRAYWDEQLIARRTQQLCHGVRPTVALRASVLAALTRCGWRLQSEPYLELTAAEQHGDEAWIAAKELAAGLLPQELHNQVRNEELEKQIEVAVNRVARKVFPE